MGMRWWSAGVVASRLPLDETLDFLEKRSDPLSQRFITTYEFNMAGISALLVLRKSVSSKTTHFIIMESIADRDSSERRLSFFSVL